MNPAFHQNIIAMVWDFDLTLIPEYMQKPLFEKYKIDGAQFWQESNALVKKYGEQGVRVNTDTSYLNHLLTYIKNGTCAGLNNQVLRELGKEIEFFPGIPDFFRISKELIKNDVVYSNYDIKLEHYIVSTGLSEIIKGSAVAEYIEDVWGCEFIEENGVLSSIAYSLDNTTKTRALFEINKGVNKYPDEIKNVNQVMEENDRRVPFSNMIYIADGPSDVPAFSVTRKGGGKTLAVFQKDENGKSFKQAKALMDDKRADYFVKADYQEDQPAYDWLMASVREIADKIVNTKKAKLSEGKGGVPGHLV